MTINYWSRTSAYGVKYYLSIDGTCPFTSYVSTREAWRLAHRALRQGTL